MLFLDPSPAQLGPWDWLIKYALPGLGWPTLILFAWKVSRYFTRAEELAKKSINTALSNIEVNNSTIKAASDTLGKLSGTFEQHTKEDDRNFKDIYDTLKEHREQSRAMLELLNSRTTLFGDVSKAIQALAEAIHHQSDVHSQQFEIIRGISERQSTLAANQEHITQGFQRVVEQLISLMKE
jgi:uncharacterized protein YjgD (DUF1641 family)